ncbi:hypothetical protein [Spirochaeta cellobiosiphila]|uniref:hypothetical protein n=1 Tax=Spirochaeta cellobiosiphila TaxID=504483 RepID=UPI00041F4D94|nr:hypothetical protein [Spirochaeta cellobiosiphila]
MEQPSPLHSFHIPVLGTGFTVDTPVKVASYGISSVISLVDDELIESMRAHYCQQWNRDYTPITKAEDNHRAKRITAYLNLINDIIDIEFEQTLENDLWRLVEMLPEGELRQAFYACKEMEGEEARSQIDLLKQKLSKGSIDVNIMTKLDGVKKYAHTALIGFAESEVEGSVVLSAGMNPGLFGILEQYDDFKANEDGVIKKKIIIKVSDYRSAMVQGRMLARKGLWVSEYRIESGLNCGGHTFPSQGVLLGPILEEFRNSRENLQTTLYNAYLKAGGKELSSSRVRITVQGGIGTHEEDKFLQSEFAMDGTGWGTPFMLVPEAINMDDDSLKLLSEAGEEDIYLSEASPLGVPFWNVHGSASETKRIERIEAGKPGAPCVKGFLALNEEFEGNPRCTASRAYQNKKLLALKAADLSTAVYDRLRQSVLDKACICHDLAGCATKKLGIDKLALPAMTPGPNLAYFKGISSLKDMVSHIYGRINLLKVKERPHMFLKELELYINYLRKQGEDFSLGLLKDGEKTIESFIKNISSGISYYHSLADKFALNTKESFLKGLDSLQAEFNSLTGVLEAKIEKTVEN